MNCKRNVQCNTSGSNEDEGDNGGKGDVSRCLSTRHALAILVSVGLCISYMLRFNLSQAMVAMVTRRNTSLVQNVTGDVCPRRNITETNHTKTGEFDWDTKTQGIIFGAFFYGYVILQIPGGWLATRYGAKWPIGMSVLLQSILTLLTPLAAKTDIWLLITVRALEGLCGGVLFPSLHSLMGQWAPANERSKMLAITGVGPYAGIVLAFVVTGWLSEHGFAGGWPSAFYVPGIAGCVWFMFWAVFAFSSPRDHPRISKTEKRMITESVGSTKSKSKLVEFEITKNNKVWVLVTTAYCIVIYKRSVPWRSLMTSRPAWAIHAACTCSGWGSYTLITELPTYLKNVLWLDISKSGFLSSLPYIVSCVLTYMWGYLADFLIGRKFFSRTGTRKLMNTIGTLGPACMLITVNYVGCDPYIVIMVICFSVGLQNADTGSLNPNMIDIAPGIAGVTKSVANTWANLTGIAAPYITGLIINDGQTKSAWAMVFYISAGIYVLDWIIYSTFASGDEQPWWREIVEINVNDEIETQDDCAPLLK